MSERADGLAPVKQVTLLPFDASRPRRSRVHQAAVVAHEARRQRHNLDVLHANGQSELNLVALATVVTGLPVVAWAHAAESSPTAGWLRPLWRLWGRRVTFVAVSPTAAAAQSEATGSPPARIHIVENPVDPARVVADRVAHDGVRVAYLGQAFEIKGFPLLGPIMERVEREGVAWDVFLDPPRSDLPLELRPPWEALYAAAE